MAPASIQELAADLRMRISDASVALREGNRGKAMLSVARNGRMFVMEFRPNEGYGIDEINDDVNNGWNMGYRHVFTDFELGAQKLLDLVLSAAPWKD